jgi:uncharacterized protein (TIGR02266 family)
MLVQLRAKDYDDLLERLAPNISQGGVFIETNKPHPEGATVFFQLATVDDGAILEAMGRVVRTVTEQEAEAPMRAGMGIEFLSMTDQSQAQLNQLVHDRQERLSGEGAAEA